MDLGRRWSFVAGTASVLAGLSVWYALRAFNLVSPDLLASPQEVLAAFFDILENGYRETTLSENIVATLGRCLVGFGAAAVTGIPLGLWMGTNRLTAASVDYIIQFLRPLPPLSYLVLLILWFGTGDLSKIVLLFMGAFPTITSAAMAGVRQVSRQRIQVARAMGASSWQIFCFVTFPSALSMIFTGLRIALAGAFSSVVAAELMAASNGLGWMVFSASRFLRNDVILLCIILLGLFGMALSRALLEIDLRLIHWRGSE
ncbi:MAG: ABC transporter permease [Hyphomicrobiales bacterium]